MAGRRRKKSNKTFRGKRRGFVDSPSDSSSDEEESSDVPGSDKDNDDDSQNEFRTELLEEIEKSSRLLRAKNQDHQSISSVIFFSSSRCKLSWGCNSARSFLTSMMP